MKTKMNLDEGYASVLEHIRRETLFQNGPRKGQVKRAIACDQFYTQVIQRLLDHNLIKFINNARGAGYVASSLS